MSLNIVLHCFTVTHKYDYDHVDDDDLTVAAWWSPSQ